MSYVYALYHKPTRSYVLAAGYYGNENNIKAFKAKDLGVSYIETYCRNKGFTLKKIRILDVT